MSFSFSTLLEVAQAEGKKKKKIKFKLKVKFTFHQPIFPRLSLSSFDRLANRAGKANKGRFALHPDSCVGTKYCQIKVPSGA